MDFIKINLLGIGGAKLEFAETSVYIDAFNKFIPAQKLNKKDIILFTHADDDHFGKKELFECYNNNAIIGPPSIAYPLLANTGLNPDSLNIVYPAHTNDPKEIKAGNLDIKVYQTKHFIDWEPDHISFLIKYMGKKIYITGDSYTFAWEDPEIYSVDALVYSLVYKDVVKGQMNSADGAQMHIPELKNLQDKLKPECIIGNHLINCDWTVSTDDMKNAIQKAGLKNIIITESIEEEIII